MIISKKLFQQVLSESNIAFEHAIVYRYKGEFGFSEANLRCIEDSSGFKWKTYDFFLEIPERKKVSVTNMLRFQMFVPRSMGQREIDNRPGLIYNNHPGEAILEESDLNNFYLVFQCKRDDSEVSSDWYVYYNCELIHVFEKVKRLGYDSYNFILEGMLFLRERPGEEDQVWVYEQGKEKAIDSKELSFGTWSYFFATKDSYRQYSEDNQVSPYAVKISDETPVLRECTIGHGWQESVASRVAKLRKNRYEQCPCCIKMYEEYQSKAKNEKRIIVKGFKQKIEEYSELLCQGIFWEQEMEFPKQVEYFFLYPNGKNSDITYFLAQKYGEVETVDGLLHKAIFVPENYEWFDCLFLGAGRNLPPSVKRDFKKKNIMYHSFMSNYYLPEKLHAIRSECTIKSVNIPEECWKKYDHAMKVQRDLLLSKRKAVYDMLLLEGRSSSRWTREQQMFFIIKKWFPDAKYQYKADWLGFQSLDVFIPSINVGMEYQGKQHFMPVEFFGGERGFRDRVRLDNEKKEKCQRRGVVLIEWRYDEPINQEIATTKLRKWLKCSASDVKEE